MTTQILAQILLGTAVISCMAFALRWITGMRSSRIANAAAVVVATLLLGLMAQSSMASSLVGATVIEDTFRNLWVPAAMFGGAFMISVTL